MSHIFDALQRSESERTGTKTPAAATELLERTERGAVASWGSEAAFAGARDAAAGFRLDPESAISAAEAAGEWLKGRPADTESDTGLPPEFGNLEISIPAHSRLVALSAPETPAAEAFRLLGVRLRHLRATRPLKKVLITSTTPEEGKSTVAANLACTLGIGKRQRTLLIDGDLRRPAMSQIFGLDELPGLCEVLSAKNRVRDCIHHLSRPGIWVLPAGRIPVNPLELMQSKKLAALMEQLASWFDWIIIDSPPVIPLADTSIWTRLADGTLLVARTGLTKKGHLQRGLESLDASKLIGAILNSSQDVDENDYNYYRSRTAAGESSE